MKNKPVSTSPKLKVLALDQSSTSSGYVFIDGGKVREMGCIRVPESLDLNARTIEMTKDIAYLVKRLKPDYLVLEEIHARPGRYTAFKALAIVRGAIIYQWWKLSLSYPIVIACSHARAQLGIKGNAKKEEVMRAVNKKFNLRIDDEHTADALVLGIVAYNLVSSPKE